MRRWLLAFALGSLAGAGGLVLAQHGHGGAGGPAVRVISATDIAEEFGGEKSTATAFEVTFGPGASSPPHRHPGAIFGYVLEGEFEFAVGGEPARVLKAGETFYEPAMALHRSARNPSTTAKARVLAVLVHPRGAKELVVPEPAAKGKE